MPFADHVIIDNTKTKFELIKEWYATLRVEEIYNHSKVDPDQTEYKYILPGPETRKT
jgi:hypothetical protein